MAKRIMSVRYNEIYLSDVTAKAYLDSNSNTILEIEFIATTEPEHPPYSTIEKRQKREISMKSTGRGIAADEYKVKTTPQGNNTKFLIETKLSAKIPGTGPEVLKKKSRK